MADTKTSAESAAAALSGPELIRGVQSAANVKITATQIKTWTSASPTLVTPVLGTPSSGNLSNCTSLSLTTGVGGTLPSANGGTGVSSTKTVTMNNSLTFVGADGITVTFPSTSATIARTDAANTFTGHQTVEGVTSTGATGTGKFVFDGTPTLVTPVLGVATATSVTANAFIANSSNTNAQTGTSYTLLTSDAGKVVTLSNAGAITLTVPASLGAGFSCTLVQLGAGQVTVTASSTTINKRVGAKLVGQYSVASLYAYATDTFILGGDLSA